MLSGAGRGRGGWRGRGGGAHSSSTESTPRAPHHSLTSTSAALRPPPIPNDPFGRAFKLYFPFDGEPLLYLLQFIYFRCHCCCRK